MIIGTTIDDAWRNTMVECFRKGIDYKVKVGSYAGQFRRQLEAAVIKISMPWVRPLAVMPPPPFPPPTSEEEIDHYFWKYLMSDIVEVNEDYTYGSYIVGVPNAQHNTSGRELKPAVDTVIDILNEAEGGTNQACISVGGVEAVVMKDPPCLRVADFKVIDFGSDVKQLYLNVFFRSWDLFAGFPQNIGGLQLLKEYVLSNLSFSCKDGPIIAYSSGLHLYSQYWEIVDKLVYTDTYKEAE